jgi:hypothetical protein
MSNNKKEESGAEFGTKSVQFIGKMYSLGYMLIEL